MSTDSSTVRAPWRFFMVKVRRVARLSPTFVRVTLTGPDLADFADNGYDQRVKLVLPVGRHGLADLPTGPDWYAQWRALPDERRHPVRTYTVRAVRPEARELDLDIALHGEIGPASRWAAAASAGDTVAILGPDAGYPGEHGGVEFRPPVRRSALLLAGDETAAPAIMSILERLPRDARGEAIIEVPYRKDQLDVHAPSSLPVRWLGRNGQPNGSRLIPAVAEAVARLVPVPAAADSSSSSDVDLDQDILWEVPEAAEPMGFYAWLAGEAGVIRTLRRQLVNERGVDRGAVAFMGYWRLGRTEDQTGSG